MRGTAATEPNFCARGVTAIILCVISFGCSVAEEGSLAEKKAPNKRVSTIIDSEHGEAIDSVVAANNAFGFHLYRTLAADANGNNLFFSPYSIESALAMTLEGARGDTAEEMGLALRFSDRLRRSDSDGQSAPWQTEVVHQGFSALNELLTGADRELDSAARDNILRQREQFDIAQAKVLKLSNQGNWTELQKAQEIEADAAQALNTALAGVDQYELRIANSL